MIITLSHEVWSLFIHISLKGLHVICYLSNHNNNNNNYNAVREIKRCRFWVLKRHRFEVPPSGRLCPFQKCCYRNSQEYMPPNPKTPHSLYSIYHHQLSCLCFKSQLAKPRLSVNSISNNLLYNFHHCRFSWTNII